MSHAKLDDLHASLSKQGGDPNRLAMVERARRFKRSWVEMAEGLVHLREAQTYLEWGYQDLHEYCERELCIRASTADKLLAGYAAVRHHAPQVLNYDGVSQTLPSLDAVHYFARAVRAQAEPEGGLEPPAEEVVDDLKRAIFEEGRSVATLRRNFEARLFPKPDGAAEMEILEKTLAATRRLEALLPAVEGLPSERIEELSGRIEGLRQELESMLAVARQELSRAS
ncbi:MAG: hypothetical protein OEY14_01990 [Myxococcales bacterium]|nr:hypothetical protein [Myxococcales bacterium]